MKIGIDIIDVARFADMKESSFSMFSDYEREYIKRKGAGAPKTMAGIYAAKEAYFKALGTGIGSPSNLQKCEIVHNESGMPIYNVSGKVLGNAALSISHTDTTAVAVCVLI